MSSISISYVTSNPSIIQFDKPRLYILYLLVGYPSLYIVYNSYIIFTEQKFLIYVIRTSIILYNRFRILYYSISDVTFGNYVIPIIYYLIYTKLLRLKLILSLLFVISIPLNRRNLRPPELTAVVVSIVTAVITVARIIAATIIIVATIISAVITTIFAVTITATPAVTIIALAIEKSVFDSKISNAINVTTTVIIKIDTVITVILRIAYVYILLTIIVITVRKAILSIIISPILSNLPT